MWPWRIPKIRGYFPKNKWETDYDDTNGWSVPIGVHGNRESRLSIDKIVFIIFWRCCILNIVTALCTTSYTFKIINTLI